MREIKRRIFIKILLTMMVTINIFVPVCGETKGMKDKSWMESHISGNSVRKQERETVSRNSSTVEDAEEISADTEMIQYSGTDGNLEWNIDSHGWLTIVGSGNYEGKGDWLLYTDYISFAKVEIQEATSLKELFRGCTNLRKIDFSGTDTSQVTDMSSMFYGCTDLEELDVSNFNTENVTNMEYMFYRCSKLEKLDVSKFNTNKVTSMNSMFNGCSELERLDLKNFNTQKVIAMNNMFYACSSLNFLDVSSFNTTNVMGMGSMFYGCSELEELDVNNFNTENVISMYNMFRECSKLKELDVSGFNTGNVTNMSCMFENCAELEKLDLSHFDTKNVVNMQAMFMGNTKLQELNLNGINTENVVNMSSMFEKCASLEKIDVSKFNTTKVSSINNMFAGCSAVEVLDVSGFDTKNVTAMTSMFYNCSAVKKLDVSNFNTEKVESFVGIFRGCSGLTSIDVSNFDTENATSMSSMFEGCSGIKKLNIDNFDTTYVTNMKDMFADCSRLETLDTFILNTYRVKNMSGMFRNCSSLTDLKVPANTSNLTDTSQMFMNCSAIKTLDLRDLYTYNVTSMTSMFSGCSSLEKLYLNASFNTQNVKQMGWMFQNCASLKSLDLGEFDTRNVVSMMGMFMGCKSLKNLDLSNFSTESLIAVQNMFHSCSGLISIRVEDKLLTKLIESKNPCFGDCELFNDIYFVSDKSDWDAIRPKWQSCSERKIRYAAVHFKDGTVEQELKHEGLFSYIENGGFGSQKIRNYKYSCDLSQFFESSYTYHHDLTRMSIRVAMAAMSTTGGTNASNIVALMEDLNLSKQTIHYPEPSYDSIGYAIGSRSIYVNNSKRTLILVAIRGGGYGQEWGGNCNVGLETHHRGFALAADQAKQGLDQYIEELKNSGITDGKDVVVWICGYSRGAATANLLAAQMDKGYSCVQPSNIHAFCFECPQNTTDMNRQNSIYSNIVNIINPKDFVTKVAMNNGFNWTFGRYGRDYVIPDEANTNISKFIDYNLAMRFEYDIDHINQIPETDMKQSILASDAARRLGNVLTRTEYFCVQETVQRVAVATMADTMDWWAFIKGLDPAFNVVLKNYVEDRKHIAILSGEFAAINEGIMNAHLPELCMAWVDSLSEDVLKTQKSFWRVFTNCPVDIYVYDNDKLVGTIQKDVPQEIENGIITMVDANGQKSIVIPGDSEYKVIYKATADGEMTISTAKYEQAENTPNAVTGYYSLPLKAGMSYEAVTTEGVFTLKDSNGKIVEPSVSQSGSEVKIYMVSLSAQGNGEISGTNSHVIGEFAKITAIPAETEEFLGWYENGQLISKDLEYRFCVTRDFNLVGTFTTNDSAKEQETKEPADKQETDNDDETIKVGNCYTVNKNTYKIISTKKKTVAFVKTSSRAKTISIPSTVKIKGGKYKVIAISANALKGNKKVTKVKIGSNVATIGNKAFHGCKNLKTITIGKGVTKIGKKAFYKCSKLKSVSVKSKKLKSVGKYAFKGIAKKASIKCPSKQLKKYKKLITKSKIGSEVKITK